MTEISSSRRAFLTMAATAPALAMGASRVHARTDDAFTYEVTRTDDAWRARLSDEEFRILREGGTEARFASPFARENAEGIYHCKGCDLPLYDSTHYSPQKVGFVFFDHSRPNAVLTDIDATDYNGLLPEPLELIEVHCRRCGSHLGHLVVLTDDPLHCINGTALRFEPAAA